MDYLKIVLDGYCNPTDKKLLKEYFIRESKKAEAESYTHEVFLTGCKTAVQTYLIGDLYRQKQEVEKELIDAKQWVRENEPDTIDQRLEQENNLNIEDYSVNLWQVTNGRYTGHMVYSEIMHISDTLDLLISVDALIDEVKNIQPPTTGKNQAPQIIEADLICPKNHLQVLHGMFDGKIWESVELNDFYLAMNKEPKRKLIPKVDNKKFVDWLEENIAPKRNKNTNMNDWFPKLIGKNLNYSTYKNKQQ